MNIPEQDSRSLADILAYRNPDVIGAFLESFEVSPAEAEQVFIETLKFLWLSETVKDQPVHAIDSPLLVIDEMWHTFILFTRAYCDFCAKYFGHYLHHTPTTASAKHEAQETEFEILKWQKLVAEKRARYNVIYDILGRETFAKWYYEFPEKFSAERLLHLRKK